MSNSFLYVAADKKGFKEAALDDLLAAGYYRMQHLMFTCNDTAIDEDGNIIPVFWLRTLVKKCRLRKTANIILRKCAGFSVSFHDASIDDEITKLYALYKQNVPFSVSSTCTDCLHQPQLPDPFDSMMVQVRDQGRLIATGYFDKGHRAIAGIINIYHPKYHAFSLGKFLMLQKFQFALSQDMLFYYTGYISTGSTRFDYKTFPDPEAVEVLLPVEQEWVPYNSVGKTFLTEYYSKFFA